MNQTKPKEPNVMAGLQKASNAAMEAVKMGKTAAEIAKGAAAGGAGIPIAVLKNPKSTVKLIILANVITIIPVLLIALLPLIIFGSVAGFVGGTLNRIGAFFQSLPIIGVLITGIASLFGGGSISDYGAEYIRFENAFDMAHIVHNLEQAHDIIGEFHLEQLEGVIGVIDEEISSLPDDDNEGRIVEGRAIGLSGNTFQFNTSVILGMYVASLHEDVMQISLEDLRDTMQLANNSHNLFTFDVDKTLEVRIVYPDPPPTFQHTLNPYTGEYETPGWVLSDRTGDFVPENWIYNELTNKYEPPPPVEMEIIVHNFIVVYIGEMVFADIFGIADNPRLMTFAHEYARNLLTLLTDTEMGAWLGIVLEAGIVDGFYSPFPNTAWSISSPFGWRPNPFTQSGQEFHNGIDIPKPISTPIRAIADGYVILSQFSGSAGNWIRIDHGYVPGFGYVISEYMHNSRNLVPVTNPRQRVYAGQVIGEVGSTGRSTGPHLHLGILVDGVHVNPTAFIGTPPQ
ncbi:MAG: M23 family metallopeptidase [Defluviitaleaceae bacterium]|nr:M23 family metallopeptidase [Defluviitaleaceae bacterium]